MCLWRYLECIYRKYVELISVHALIKLFLNIHSAKCCDH